MSDYFFYVVDERGDLICNSARMAAGSVGDIRIAVWRLRRLQRLRGAVRRMTMFAFNPNVFQPVNTMLLYLIFNGIEFGVDIDAPSFIGAYWAETEILAADKASEDTGLSYNHLFSLEAGPARTALFHTPGFEGRQVGAFYYLKGAYAHELGFFYVVADTLEDAWKFAESEAPVGYETRYLHKLTRKEAGAMFEKGWGL